MTEKVYHGEPDELEKLAIDTVDQAFERNKAYWQTTHDRQRRLYKMVMGGEDSAKVVADGRSHIKTGIPFMIYHIILAILKNAIFSVNKNVQLMPTKLRKIIAGQEEMEEYVDFTLMDESIPVKHEVEMGLSDLISHGTCCLRPYFFNDVKTLWDGEKEFESLVYSGTAFKNHAVWDTYPTAGATSTGQLHEVIFVESFYPHELREWEKNGWIKNVDELLKDYKEPSFTGSDTEEHKDPRQVKGDLEVDSYGRIDILIYWGLFPLYKYEKYVDDNGKDRSADEVECLIIKPVGKKINLSAERNPYFHQQKEVIFGKYFDIPGELHGESIFGIMERLLIHQEDWFNIIQDAANYDVGPDVIMPTNVDQAERKQIGPQRTYTLDPEDVAEGKVPQYVKRPPSVLGDTYEQRDYIGRLVQEVSAIMDFLRGIEGKVPKTKFEVEQLAQSINARFEQTALSVQGSYIVPVVNWIMSTLSQFSQDEYIQAYTGLPFNPFKQFDPMMPNTGYRISLEGSIRAIKNVGLQNQLRSFIEMAKDMEPMPDENGVLKRPNAVEMFFDLVKMSGLRDTDKYELEVQLPPEMAPGTEPGMPGQDMNQPAGVPGV